MTKAQFYRTKKSEKTLAELKSLRIILMRESEQFKPRDFYISDGELYINTDDKIDVTIEGAPMIEWLKENCQVISHLDKVIIISGFKPYINLINEGE